MAEVVDTFELRHVSTTYSEDKDGNTLTHFNCHNAAGFGLVYDTAIFYDLKSDVDAGKLIRIGHAFARDGSLYTRSRLGEMGESAWRACVEN